MKLMVLAVFLILFRRLNWWLIAYCSWKDGQLMISVAIVGCVFKWIFVSIMCHCQRQAHRDQRFLSQALGIWTLAIGQWDFKEHVLSNAVCNILINFLVLGDTLI